ncbi:DNA mismatch repair protein MutS [[Empedobacter] haloabium]|uniref:DNA mismatch repair protein MutS n=1 Tax=[Empedobacter] haloabium TaxID=592317 RepID=A0ABZ1UJH2_9BURK
MGWLFSNGDDRIVDHPFGRAAIARFHLLTAAADERGMDAQTTRDLLLDDYADRLGAGSSLFGRQALHRRLHGAAPAEPARIRALLAAPDLLAQLVQACRPLRRAEADVVPSLFGTPLAPAPGWARWLPLLPVAWLASLVLAFFVPLGWVGAVALTFVLVALQASWHERTQEWDSVLLPLRTLLDVHQALGNLPDPTGLLAPFAPDAAQAGKLRRRFALSLADSIPGQREYRDWLLQANLKRYFASRAALVQHLDFLRASYRLVAELEADCTLARHLEASATFCWAGQSDDRAVDLRGVVHPLLARPAPVDFRLVAGTGAFVSGQNGVGKSTLLRTLGLNLVVARAFGFCYATSAQVPNLPVYASMHSEDAMDSGESLYMAELRRARELLALARLGPAVFVIDEIFRGTNHLESVSAATAVLHELARHHLVLVSSHNLELAPLLRDRLAPFCVEAAGEGVTVRPGVLRATNGIRLLADSGFDSAIECNAVTVFQWLSRHARGEEAGPPPVL